MWSLFQFLCVDLFARETEVTALIDVAEHAEAEVDGADDFGVEGAESVFGLLERDGADHLLGYTFLVGGGTKVGFRLKVVAKAVVRLTVGCEDESVGE